MDTEEYVRTYDFDFLRVCGHKFERKHPVTAFPQAEFMFLLLHAEAYRPRRCPSAW